METIVFTDLDGTLLDHDSYSFAAAQPALEMLREASVPVVLVTSKTRAEVEPLRVQLDNGEPFVVENGAAIYFPPGYEAALPDGAERSEEFDVIRLGEPVARIRAFMASVSDRFALRGFGDMSDEEVAERTDLGLEGARRARQREFSEPFVLEDGDLKELERAAAEHGLAITTGGRFHHLIGAGQDKGKAVLLVRDAMADRVARTIGLGDGKNDVPMLEVVDVAVVIPRPDGTHLELEREGAILAPSPGSRGWNDAVAGILSNLADIT